MQCLPLYRTQIVNTTIQICQRDKCLIPGMSVDIGSQQYDHKLWLLTKYWKIYQKLQTELNTNILNPKRN